MNNDETLYPIGFQDLKERRRRQGPDKAPNSVCGSDGGFTSDSNEFSLGIRTTLSLVVVVSVSDILLQCSFADLLVRPLNTVS